MTGYHLLTIWHIDASLPAVYDAVQDSMLWPEWWPGCEKVERLASGDEHGINDIRRYSWRGDLPYPLVFELRATRIEALAGIEGLARGDLEGRGRWHFTHTGKVSIVRLEWHVHSTRWWMNLLAPVARPAFIRNHGLIMDQGGEQLAQRLGARLLSRKNIDLATGTVLPAALPARSSEHGRIDPLMLLVVGVGGGILATFVQIVLWWLADMPVVETLIRDTRLTAAVLMGPEVLPPPLTLRWDIVLLAALTHFAISIACTIAPALLASRLPAGPNLVAGAWYGLGIYIVNLHGFTLLFPWFSVARDWATLLTHVFFGMALTVGCWWFARRYRKTQAKMQGDVRTVRAIR